MQNEIEHDVISGKKVPQLYLNEDYVLTGIHRGTVNVKSGEFTLKGVLQGSLNMQSNDVAKIEGDQQGSVAILQNSTVVVTGAINGSTFVQKGSTLIIESGAKLAGSLTNNGTVILRGVFGGVRNGNGDFIIEGKGYIVKPIIKNGAFYYNF